MDMSLKWKAALIFLFIVFIPIVTIGAIVIYQSNQIFKQQLIQTTNNNLRHMEARLLNEIEIIEEISSYMIFSEEVRQFMKFPQRKGDRYQEFRQLENNIKGFFTFHLSDKEFFNSVKIESMNGEVLNVGEPIYGEEDVLNEQPGDQSGKIRWSAPYPMTSGWYHQEKDVISLYRIINDLHDIKTSIGRILIRLNVQELFMYVTDGFRENGKQAFFIFSDGIIVGEEENSIVNELTKRDYLTKEIKEWDFLFKVDGETYYGMSQSIDALDLSIVSVVSKNYILSETSTVQRTFQSLLIIVFVIAVLAFLGFIMTIVRPILELTSETKKVEGGDFKARVKIRTNDEIGALGLTFNRMVARIERLIKQKYELEIENKQSELKSLQAQINPHFLYNTLDMIRWTARMEEAHETSRSIEDLSHLFRKTLRRGSMWISFEEEIEHVHRYLKLQKRRLGETFCYSIFYEAGLENAIVMKIILEPLVENSILHGFRNVTTKKYIQIKGFQQDKKLYIDVLDNGVGFNVDRLQKKLDAPASPDQENGFALRNIHRRITNSFGNTYGLSFFTNNRGAHIRVILPLIKNQEELNKFLKGKENEHANKFADR